MQASLIPPEQLARRAEERIASFVEKFRPRWLYVDWSGGKDSTAVLAAAVSCCREKVVATFLHLAGQTHLDNARVVLMAARRLGLRVYRYTGLRQPGELRAALTRDKPWESAPALVYVVTTVNGMDYWEATKKYGFEAPLERFGGGKRWACANMKNKWLAARPPNALYEGKPARLVVVGVRRTESPYRARLWAGKTWQVFGEKYQREPDIALAPIVDMSDSDVWTMLRHYGLYDIVKRQYERWRRAPNCVLCPLAGKAAIRLAVSNLPSGYLRRTLAVLKEIQPRYKPSTFSYQRISEWLSMIEEELERRRGWEP